ncbi:MAG: periplasmic Cu(I)/Cu(II)-binding protein CopK [Gammaproteobacteria bacterium]|nr:periplasmic Cu(I)/Cu(II)-binding protein CopK [Sideroxydans sp.]MBU3903922.1 periplasmic Cu(I)/Cu(II)-binding protein CopK [Gammaproteobacteria bacterium]MBU4046611.1 periplasmic Cu(I)/Cu(II)-binding protein CopK [Gammaproteobacteria bacterium]MBU4151072.1 periplasmic Cu(I)/Cu(II)-binding protein CopK [Gammaproteobacteria bacterium]
MKKLLIASIFAAMSTSVFAVDAAQVDKSIPLKDGTTLYIFKDGKMSMEDKYGRATRMKENQVMETKDGQKIMMHGDEVMRLDDYLNKDYRG